MFQRTTTAVAALSAALLLPALASAQAITIDVPTELQPKTIAEGLMSTVGGYVLPILTIVIVIGAGLALVRFIKKVPNKIAK